MMLTKSAEDGTLVCIEWSKWYNKKVGRHFLETAESGQHIKDGEELYSVHDFATAQERDALVEELGL